MHSVAAGAALGAVVGAPARLGGGARAPSTAASVSLEAGLADIGQVIMGLAESGAFSKTVTPK